MINKWLMIVEWFWFWLIMMVHGYDYGWVIDDESSLVLTTNYHESYMIKKHPHSFHKLNQSIVQYQPPRLSWYVLEQWTTHPVCPLHSTTTKFITHSICSSARVHTLRAISHGTLLAPRHEAFHRRRICSSQPGGTDSVPGRADGRGGPEFRVVTWCVANGCGNTTWAPVHHDESPGPSKRNIEKRWCGMRLPFDVFISGNQV